MELEGQSTLLRIFIGERDKIGHKPMYEVILHAARQQHLAGATVLRGIMGFGASSRIHTAAFIDIAEDLPIVLEIVDQEAKINGFIPTVQALFDEGRRGGLITIEKVNVLYYRPKQ